VRLTVAGHGSRGLTKLVKPHRDRLSLVHRFGSPLSAYDRSQSDRRNEDTRCQEQTEPAMREKSGQSPDSQVLPGWLATVNLHCAPILPTVWKSIVPALAATLRIASSIMRVCWTLEGASRIKDHGLVRVRTPPWALPIRGCGRGFRSCVRFPVRQCGGSWPTPGPAARN
jgi:hypothetical protein